MILDFGLTKEYKAKLGLGKKEEIYYCIPYDIDAAGNYIKDAFVVVSTQRIFVLEKGELKESFLLSDLLEVKAESEISCGIFFVVPKATKEAQVVVRYSAKHLARFAYVARGCGELIAGSSRKIVSEEYEKTCFKCGRALPGTKECPHCSKKKEGVMNDFFRLLKPYKLQLLFIIGIMIMVAVTSLLNPEVQKRLVDNVLDDRRGTVSQAIICLAAMFAISMLTMALNISKNYFCSKLGSTISMDLRRKLYAKIQLLSLSFINDRKPGDLMNRVVHDTRNVSNFMADAFCNLFTVAIMLVFSVTYMLILDWKLALLSFLFIPVSVSISIAFRKNIHRRFHMQRKKEDKINSNLRDVITGMAVVKSYGKEEAETQRFNETAESYATVQKRNEVFWAVFFPAMNFVMGIGTYLITYAGGKSVLQGDKTVGELMQFVNYTSMMYMYVGWLSNLPRIVMNMVTSVERISDVMHQEPKIVDSENATEHSIEGDIEFKNVTFGYKSYEPVLEHIDLKVNKGEMIGLVGASGTGKSTLINLIMHLYDIDDGELLIDGINIKDIKAENYHSQIGVVLQETFLFSGTILNNIKFARPEATTMEVIRAAKMANAHDFICKTPDGYNTYVGERGYNLSGGERQRIAIARAILNEPKLLILDEATASLDTESEYLIQTALDRLTSGKTTFAIAHRLSTLKNADRLVVIDGHHIAEVGTHNELMEKKGIYYGLVTAQLEMQNSKKTEGSDNNNE